MKALCGLFFLVCLASCGHNTAQPETHPTSAALPAATTMPVDSLRQHLKQLFRAWQQQELTRGRLWARDSCRASWFARHPVGEGDVPWGFPDAADYTFSYADLNQDGKLDQLVTFVPAQCDGGNGSMWAQVQVLTLSQGSSYRTATSLDEGSLPFSPKNQPGFYQYDSMGRNKIYGTYYQFAPDDGHCCPSTAVPVTYFYDSQKIIRTTEQ